MKTIRQFVVALALAMGALPCAMAQSNSAPGPVPVLRAQPAVSADEQARFLAGLPVAGPLEPLTRTAAWREHAAAMDSAWSRMEQRQLARVRSLAPQLPQAQTLFYFFSGPDFLYADALFPGASNYVLCAIEPTGTLPNLRSLDEGSLAAYLGGLRASLKTMLAFHYFITKEMRADLSAGALPLLYIFVARTGHHIQDVAPMDGGVRVAFNRPGGPSKRLYYFRTDLSNGARNAAFFDFCRQFGNAAALIKSASYLLHQDRFSKARTFLLQNTHTIVQDDSGLPFRSFAQGPWTVRLLGNYPGAEGIFAAYHQPDLLEAYRRSSPPPLPFAFGYDSSPRKATLMIASRR